jgi:hypothetical protein
VHFTLPSKTGEQRARKWVVFSGSVTPASTGEVVLAIKRHGAKTVRKTVRLSHSKFHLRFEVARPGAYRVVATYPTGDHRLGASSRAASVRVRR